MTAPSNVAVDNIILRIIEDGFVDGQGRRYNPSMVRVGRGQSERVRAVSLDQQVDDFLRESEQMLRQRLMLLREEMASRQQALLVSRAKVRALMREVRHPLPYKWEARVTDDLKVYYVDHNTKTTSNHIPPPPPTDDVVAASRYVKLEQMPEHMKFAGEVTSLVEFMEGHKMEIARCEYRLQALYAQQTGGITMDQVRQQLETNIIDTAHLVFTTLNSAGSASLINGARFSVVVTDEAAQAIEPTTLIPLQLGAVNCVLVGDPQQLPATVFSKSSDLAFERSLFERLEHVGHPVHLLDTQYRMHPKISAFPRRHFYGSLLKDGENVLMDEKYTRPYHRFAALQPFTFLNLYSTVDTGPGGPSFMNPAEARLVVNIFQTLKRISPEEVQGGKVGVITPYAAQQAELCSQFSRALGPAYKEEVEINTVDGYQGKEKDIIIISCVRAGGSRGIGFLSDIRRMNVGLTRGKYAVLMVGREDTLSRNSHWAALISHAKETGAFVEVPDPGFDLLSLEAWVPGASRLQPGPRGGRGGRGDGGKGPREGGRGGGRGPRGGGGRGRGNLRPPNTNRPVQPPPPMLPIGMPPSMTPPLPALGRPLLPPRPILPPQHSPQQPRPPYQGQPHGGYYPPP